MRPPELLEGVRLNFTADHRRLLRLIGIFLEPSRLGATADNGFLPVPCLDPKRPYGDMSYYPLDIAAELGLSVDYPDYDQTPGIPPFEAEKLERLVRLHLESLSALSVFLRAATLEFATYHLDSKGFWEKAV